MAAPSWLATQPPTAIWIGLVYVGGLFVTLGRAEDICHLVRVVLVHLAAEGFDEDFAAHGEAF